VSSVWTSPDPRPSGGGTAFGQPPPAAEPGPPVTQDLWAGLVTVAVTVLAGAPVGLLWAALAPRFADAAVAAGQGASAATAGAALLAVDASYLGAVVVAGLATGVLTWRLGSQHGPAVVVGLTVGGLVAGSVAMSVGGLVGSRPLGELLASGQDLTGLAVDLRATAVIAGWPVASLLVVVVSALRAGRREGRAGSGGRPAPD